MLEGTCTIDGCNDVIKAKGLCSRHHQRWYRSKHVKPSTRRKRKPCVIDGCERLTAAHDFYCANHKRRFELYGDPLGGRQVIERCTVEGCGRRHRAKGLCGRHYSIVRKLEVTTLNFVIRKLDEHIQDAECDDNQYCRDAFRTFKKFLETVAETVPLVAVGAVNG